MCKSRRPYYPTAAFSLLEGTFQIPPQRSSTQSIHPSLSRVSRPPATCPRFVGSTQQSYCPMGWYCSSAGQMEVLAAHRHLPLRCSTTPRQTVSHLRAPWQRRASISRQRCFRMAKFWLLGDSPLEDFQWRPPNCTIPALERLAPLGTET